MIEALTRAGRPVNNGELATLMGVSAGEASKRRQAVAERLAMRRDRHGLVISLKDPAFH